VLLREMQIQNPTAVMIARTAVAQDDITGCAHAGHRCPTSHPYKQPGASPRRRSGPAEAGNRARRPAETARPRRCCSLAS